MRKTNILLEHDIDVYSTQPVNLISITNFFLYTTGDLYSSDENYDNHNSTTIDRNNIIYFLWQLIKH